MNSSNKDSESEVPVYTNTRKVRIEWGDCDPAGIIFNPRYFEIFDAATAGLFESVLGINKREMLIKYKSGGIPVLQTGAKFIKPPRYGDDIEVASSISFGRSSFKVQHRVTRGGELYAEGAETRVWVIREGDGMKSSPVPEEIKRAFGL